MSLMCGIYKSRPRVEWCLWGGEMVGRWNGEMLAKGYTLSVKSSGELIYNSDIANSTVQFSSVAQACPTLCNTMNRSAPGLPVHHQLPEFTQTHVHWVGDATQPSHSLSSPFPPKKLSFCLFVFWFCFLFEYFESPLLFCMWSGKRLSNMNLPTNWYFL